VDGSSAEGVTRDDDTAPPQPTGRWHRWLVTRSVLRRRWDRPVVAAAAAIVAYYAYPVDEGGGRLVAAVAVTLLGVTLLGWAIWGLVRRVLHGDPEVRPTTLATLVALSIVVFALGYFMLDRSRPDEFAGLETKTDSLYFTLTTLTTVGFGDIFAQGQVARALVAVQIVFNVVFVAGGVRLVVGSVRDRAATSGEASHPPQRDPRHDQ
jgi:voltage-gated potassium channel